MEEVDAELENDEYVKRIRQIIENEATTCDNPYFKMLVSKK